MGRDVRPVGDCRDGRDRRVPFVLRPLLACIFAACIGCAGSSVPAAPSSPSIRLSTASDGTASYIEVAGLSSRVLGALAASPRSKDEWASLLRVAVDADGPPMLGEHAVADGAIRFTPQFPLDPGREYQVRFNPGAVPSWDGDEAHVVTAMVGRPAAAVSPSTVVTRVYPSGDTVPANLLRMYIEFSAPMGRKSGIEHLTLLDHDGTEIPGAVLPLDYEFWSQDHQRFTVFFDPGRVKRGILPNQQMGRPLEAGRTVTLVVGAEWRDAQGQPLREGFRRQYRVTQPEESPLATSQWRLQAPTAGSRDAMAVSFPKSLDYGLLMRTLGVTRDGQSIDGDVAVERAETRWTFTPKEPWRAGAYQVTALDILEDVAGNQIGRAFEVDNFDTVDKSPNPQTVSLRFDVR